MKTISKIFAAMLLTLAGTASAVPVTVTFEDVATGAHATAISAGFRFHLGGAGALYYVNGLACNPACAANGTRTLLAAGPSFQYGNVVTMSRAGGGTFVVTGLDAGEMFSGGHPEFAATQINYVGTLSNVTVTSGTLNLDGLIDGPGGINDFQTFGLNAALVDTIVFSGAGGAGNNGFSLDNLTVQDAVVPEPGTLALAGLGLLGLARSRRRRA